MNLVSNVLIFISCIYNNREVLERIKASRAY